MKNVSFEELYTIDLFFEAIHHHPFHKVLFENRDLHFLVESFELAHFNEIR
jgi:hypothetical protein